jgi:hypothetical protein
VIVQLLDIEWLLSTLFDASLFKLRAAGNGGSFFYCANFGQRRTDSGRRLNDFYAPFRGLSSAVCPVSFRNRVRTATMSASSADGRWTAKHSPRKVDGPRQGWRKIKKLT